MKYEITSEGVVFDGRKVGPVAVLVSHSEPDVKALQKAGATKAVLPVGDYLVPVGDKVLGIESKRPMDLESSRRSRRLQRQLRWLREACDYYALGIRADSVWHGVELDEETLVSIAEWQAIGGLLLLLPSNPARLVGYLRGLQAVMKPGPHLFNVIAGTDLDRARLKVSGCQCVVALRRLVKGVGPRLAARLAEATEHNWRRVLYDEELVRSTGGKRVASYVAWLVAPH